MEIIKNAPIPPKQKKKSAIVDTVIAMAVGDSVIVQTESEVASIAAALARRGFSTEQRRFRDKPGYQVWKVEKRKG